MIRTVNIILSGLFVGGLFLVGLYFLRESVTVFCLFSWVMFILFLLQVICGWFVNNGKLK